MQDLSGLISDYRNALVILWNDFFRKHHVSLMECGPLDDYEVITKRLFAGLVLKPALGCKAPISDTAGDKIAISVRPAGMNVEVMFGELNEGYFAWSAPINIRGDEYSFGFIELFEFDRYGDIKLPYVKCQVLSVGGKLDTPKYALLDFSDCQFYL